jgi:hypothetical protein
MTNGACLGDGDGRMDGEMILMPDRNGDQPDKYALLP